MGWLASIFDARDSKSETLSKEGPDGNYAYDKSGTYGQSDYTVRERTDGTLMYMLNQIQNEATHTIR